MPKLYDLTSEFYCLERYKENASEEEAEKIAEKLDAITADIKSKGLNIALITKSMESEIEMFKKTECEIRRRRQLMDKKLQWLKDYLRNNMETCGITKISNEYLEIRLKKNPSHIELYNEELLPQKFLKEKIIYSPNKELIKKTIIKGDEVPGAVLKQGTRVEIK